MPHSAAAKTFFVTGTDTGVGKTHVAVALLHAFSAQGLKTAALKPVAAGADTVCESGSAANVEAMANSDAVALHQAANAGQNLAQVNPVLLHDAIAPHIAAQQAGRALSVSELIDAVRIAQQGADVLVVEGAGGWLVPINERQTLADVAAGLQAQVILVVGMRLGCLNHALLSAAAIRASGCELAAWVANVIDPDMPALRANIDYLKQQLDAPMIAELAWAPAKSPACTANEIQTAALLA
ncbi:MAG: dethiobiotin synthase [Pseudomonadales bacterium]|nr:dethiobiotin synthase [Pseudomonadales bacterium]